MPNIRWDLLIAGIAVFALSIYNIVMALRRLK